MPNYGWDTGESDAVDWIFDYEPSCDPKARNPSSTARGIPPMLKTGGSLISPHLKEGALRADLINPFEDYGTNPKTQIKWGLDYIKNRYGG